LRHVLGSIVYGSGNASLYKEKNMEETTDNHNTPGPKGFVRSRWRRILIVLLGAAVVALYLGGYLHVPDPLEGKMAKVFSLTTLDGKKMNLSDHLGKDAVLLDFWAVWCPPCRESVPALAKIAEEFGPRGLAVYAVNQQDSPDAVRNFLKNANVSLPVLMDPESVAGDLYGVTGIPKMVLIGRTGTVVFVNIGYGPGSEWRIRRAVAAALK
jgi:peroxiredoxin